MGSFSGGAAEAIVILRQGRGGSEVKIPILAAKNVAM